MSNIASFGGMASRATACALCGCVERRATIASMGSMQLVAARSSSDFAISTRSCSTSDLPVSSPIALKNVYAIAPPMSSPIDFGQQLPR